MLFSGTRIVPRLRLIHWSPPQVEMFLALDAKVNFDANALFRHPDVVELRDLSEEDPKEVEASKFDLNYIALDGNVACMVNGAGLAMATMDIIKHYGGSPLTFLMLVEERRRSRLRMHFAYWFLMMRSKQFSLIFLAGL